MVWMFLWNNHLDFILLAFELLKLTHLVKTTSTACCYILIYVDDIIFLGSSSIALDELIKSLNSTFALKDLGKLSYFLGIEVSYPEKGGMFLSQSKYILDLLHQTKMAEAQPIATPMISGPILSACQGELFYDPYLYRSVVGALQYATFTHPEISFSVNKAYQFMRSPTILHWQMVKRILRYLKEVLSRGLWLQKSVISIYMAL